MVTWIAATSPACQRYRSGPAEPSAGLAENASQPADEYAASPTIVTPDAISSAPAGVLTGVALGSTTGLSPGPALVTGGVGGAGGSEAGVSVSPGPGLDSGRT